MVTTVFLPLMELINWFLLMLRKGLPNKAKQRASRMVDLPSPFLPMIRVVGDLFSRTLFGELPVDRKLHHSIDLKTII
jgi:hypothetical protein